MPSTGKQLIMSKLIVYRAKPNPAGKDKVHHVPVLRQLQAEWVDIKNISQANLRLTRVSVDHRAFSQGCSNPKHSEYWKDREGLVLGSGQVLRIHTGRSADSRHMADEDRHGAHVHGWGEHGTFKLNNGACRDRLTIWFFDATWTKIDEAGYDPYPPEGQVLVREGDKLVARIARLAGQPW